MITRTAQFRILRRSQQRGVVFLATAGFMLLAVMSLALVVDTGRLYVVKRNLQRLADLAAIEVMSRDGRCGDGSATQYATDSLARNGFVPDASRKLLTACGQLATANGVRGLVSTPAGGVDNAASVTLTQDVPASLVAGGLFGQTLTLSASATATDTGVPLAALILRSTLLTVDITNSSKAKLLSDVFGGLLGGSLNISVGAWNGLIHTQLNLFQYLDQLATNIGLDAGDYDEVLASDVSTGELIQAAIDVLESQNGTPQTTINALDAIVALDQILVATQGAPVNLHVSDLLALQTGTPYAGAEASIQSYELVQGIVQLANKSNAAMASIPISAGGVNVDVKIKVIEPPQLSAVGNPELASAEAYLPVNSSPNRIYVRSAQLRLLASVSLSSSLTSLVGTLQSTLTGILSPLTTLLNSLLSLNLNGVLGTLICVGCQQTFADPVILPSPFRFDVNLDVGGGSSRVTDYSCSGGNKSLTAYTETAAATLR
ncbi:MAG: pilus assembly protein TadG-related protein, partial [Perlucidibaca sp.]